MAIQFSPPDLTEHEIEKVVEVLRSGWITTGPKTKELEDRIAAYCGTPRCVCLSSATAAMELTLRLMGIGPGDEVITSTYTYTASASVAAHVGARVILVDTGKDSFEMDYEQLAEAITEKTKAIIPVDIGGVMADYRRVISIAQQRKSMFRPTHPLQEALGRVLVLADAAHSFGAISEGVPSGALADFTCFSLHAVKNLTTAEGGAITWRPDFPAESDDLYRQFMLLSLHGQSMDALEKAKLGAWAYDISLLGYKCNMTDIAAALGLGQLDRYEHLLARRRAIIERYDRGLANAAISPLLHYGPDFASSGHLYIVRLLGRTEAFRNRVIKRLAAQGIPTNVHYKPLPLFTAYQQLGYSIHDYPNAFRQYENALSLPCHTKLSDEDVDQIVAGLIAAIQQEAEVSTWNQTSGKS